MALVPRMFAWLDHQRRFHWSRVPGWIGKWEARLRGAELGHDLAFFGRPLFVLHPGSTLRIGNGVSLISDSRRCSTANLYGPCRFQTDSPTSAIIVGHHTGLNGTSIWCRSTEVLIGDASAIGPNTVIMDSPGHPLWPPSARRHYPGTNLDRPVFIGDQVWIGNGVLVLAGSRIGHGSVVAARSVVTGILPENVLAAGVPARVIRKLGDND